MDFQHIETFLKVTELHSFSRAAMQLGYSQSAVSTQIAKLEQELGHMLFDRIGHRITLTEKGHTFLQYAQQVMLLTETMQQTFYERPVTGGSLRIAMADSLCSSLFGDVILRYQEQYPAVFVNLKTGLTDDMFLWLAHNEIDMVYTLDNRITRSELVVLSEEPEPVHFYVCANHPLLSEDTLTWDKLRQFPVYMTEMGISYRKNLDLFLGNQGIELTPTLELGNVQLIRFLIDQSNGIGFLPEFVVKDALLNGTIQPLTIPGLHIEVWKQLIYHRGKSVTPAMEALISLLELHS